MVYIIMGVAGCGKTTIGKRLAEKIGCRFIEGDEYHPVDNITKMSSGIPLTDDDRYDWLMSLRKEIEAPIGANENIVASCSALKEKYRQILKRDNESVKFVYLKGSYEMIEKRMSARKNHYMKAGMLQSQFDALEEPEDAVVIDASLSAEEIVEIILSYRKITTSTQSH